ncbi:MAG: 4Fe-4S binding protein [Treponema sp.]|nr:4Fe-4S binding protein [Treponema sp.]
MSKRQNIRKAIIMMMFFFFPITITWLSPAIPVLYPWFVGVFPGALIIFSLLFLVSLFMGRAFCGYVCSVGGMQECMMLAREKKIKSARINIIKYIIWLPWIIFIIIAFVQYGGIYKIDFFAGTVDNYMFLIAPYRYIIYFGVILLVAVLHLLVGKRAFCHSVCWGAPFMIIGTKVSGWLRLPRLSLKSNQDSCTGCKLCSKKCPMSLDVETMVKTANMKNSECILCGECIDICPKKSITYTFKNK